MFIKPPNTHMPHISLSRHVSIPARFTLPRVVTVPFDSRLLMDLPSLVLITDTAFPQFLVANPMRLTSYECAVLRIEFPDHPALAPRKR